mgnify:CR=1 FL=1
MNMQSINLAEKLSTFGELWSPRIVAGFNGHDVMVVKVNGEFNWHSHPDTDDLFLVLSGRLTIQMRDGDVVLCDGTCVSAHDIVEAILDGRASP